MLAQGAESSKKIFRILKDREKASIAEITTAADISTTVVRKVMDYFLCLELVDFKTTRRHRNKPCAHFFLTDAAREMDTFDDVLKVQPWIYKGK